MSRQGEQFAATDDMLVSFFCENSNGTFFENVLFLLQENDPDASDLHVDYAYFEEEIWPNLAHRIPAFEKLKVRSYFLGVLS